MHILRLSLFIWWISFCSISALQAQDSTFRMGIRAGYGLELPSRNYVGTQNYYLLEAGHRFSYGAFFDVEAAPKTQFSLQFGLEHQFWPKGLAYSADCTSDSFPTFLSVSDSLPGRDHRLISFYVEPSFRFRVGQKGIFFRPYLPMAFVFQSKVEEYRFSCTGEVPLGWRDYQPGEYRKNQRFNVGLGLALAKEVRVNARSGFVLETGLRFMLSQLFYVRDADLDGPRFSLMPWGFHVNIGFFR